MIVGVSLLGGGSVNAAQSGLFTYEVVSGQAEITAYPAGETGHLDIPVELDGFKVVAITGHFANARGFPGLESQLGHDS